MFFIIKKKYKIGTLGKFFDPKPMNMRAKITRFPG